MYETGYEKRLVSANTEFENRYGINSLTDSFWTGNVSRDPATGCYYAWQIRWSAGDSEGWVYLGSDFETACRELRNSFGR